MFRIREQTIIKAKKIESEIKFDKIWATAYSSFGREFNTNKIFAFGLNNYAQLALVEKSRRKIINTPSLTEFQNVIKIVGKNLKMHRLFAHSKTVNYLI